MSTGQLSPDEESILLPLLYSPLGLPSVVADIAVYVQLLD